MVVGLAGPSHPGAASAAVAAAPRKSRANGGVWDSSYLDRASGVSQAHGSLENSSYNRRTGRERGAENARYTTYVGQELQVIGDGM